MKIELKLPAYTPAQEEIFVNSSARRRFVQKGRRFGFTKGAAVYCIRSMLAGDRKSVLWGDVTLLNIRSYVERLFLPLLAPLPSCAWSWHATNKRLRIGASEIDFRSADQPENWEGFGYDLVILNEAGIILKDRYIWQNAVSPMLLDNPDAVAIIGGTPKGKNLFYELCTQAEATEGWQLFTYSTYDNPVLKKSAIDELIAELGGSGDVVDQEIYGKFIDLSLFELIGLDNVIKAMERESAPGEGPEVWGVDVARHGADTSVIARRKGLDIYRLDKMRVPDTSLLAERVAELYAEADIKPHTIFIEVNGLGWGVYDSAARLGLPVFPADTAAKSAKPKVLNKRAEMYTRLKEHIQHGGSLPQDNRLKTALGAVEYSIEDDGVLRLMPKAHIKQKIGYSPDEADACALTYYAPVREGAHHAAKQLSKVKLR